MSDDLTIPRDVVKRVLDFQFDFNRGHGFYACRSCGAMGCSDFDQDRVRDRREACSVHCPWGRLRLMYEDQTGEGERR